MQNRRLLWIGLVTVPCWAACELEAETFDSHAERTALIDFGDGPVPISYEDIDGWAVIDDMILARTAEIETDQFYLPPLTVPPSSGDDGLIHSAIRTRAWPGGRVPYTIDNDLNLFVKASIAHAIDVWNDTGAVYIVPANSNDTTVVDFRPATEEMNFSPTEGKSMVGYNASDSERPIHLGSLMGPSGVTHELGHAIGLKHEQQRRDRDDYVSINYSNIRENKDANFEMFGSSWDLKEFGGYDYSSIMHYNSYAFAEDSSKATIVKKGCSFTDPGSNCLIQRDSEPTLGDIRGVYRIHAGESRKFRNDWNENCLRPVNGTRNTGARIVTSACSNTRSRRWFAYARNTGGFWIVNENSTKCLTAPKPWDDDDGMTQAPCDFLATQLFDIPSQGSGVQLRLRGTNQCVKRIASKNKVILSANCNSASSRRWK